MEQNVKDTNASILIGRDANEAVIKIDISHIKNELSKTNKPTKPHVPYVKLLLWIAGLSVLFFVLFVLLNHFVGFGISDDSIILTFVGIVATFVVVSNYIQVKEVEKKFDEKIKDIKKFSTTIEKNKWDIKTEVAELKNMVLRNKLESEAGVYTTLATFYFESGEFEKSFSVYFAALKNYVSVENHTSTNAILNQMFRSLNNSHNKNVFFDVADIIKQYLSKISNPEAQIILDLLENKPTDKK